MVMHLFSSLTRKILVISLRGIAGVEKSSRLQRSGELTFTTPPTNYFLQSQSTALEAI